MVTGKHFGSGIATASNGLTVPYTLIRAERSPETVKDLARESQRWHQVVANYKAAVISGAPVSFEVAQRAQFADDVFGVAMNNVMLAVGSTMMAQASDGRILGVLHYFLDPVTHKLSLNLLAISPEHVPGTPGSEQLRGVGTGLVAAMARDALNQGVQEVVLHPLDAEAQRFWQGRGFVVCGLGALHCLRGTAAINNLMRSCEVRPDCDGDDCLMCGTQKAALPGRIVK